MTSKVFQFWLWETGRHFRQQEGGLKGRGKGGAVMEGRVVEVAPAAPPAAGPWPPGFRYVWRKRAGPGRRRESPGALLAPAGARLRPAVGSAPARDVKSPQATPSARLSTAEARPLLCTSSPFRGPGRGPNIRQRRSRHRVPCVPSSAKDRPRARIPADI